MKAARQEKWIVDFPRVAPLKDDTEGVSESPSNIRSFHQEQRMIDIESL